MNKFLAASLMLLTFSLGCLVTGQRYGSLMDEQKEAFTQTIKVKEADANLQRTRGDLWKGNADEALAALMRLNASITDYAKQRESTQYGECEFRMIPSGKLRKPSDPR